MYRKRGSQMQNAFGTPPRRFCLMAKRHYFLIVLQSKKRKFRASKSLPSAFFAGASSKTQPRSRTAEPCMCRVRPLLPALCLGAGNWTEKMYRNFPMSQDIGKVLARRSRVCAEFDPCYPHSLVRLIGPRKCTERGGVKCKMHLVLPLVVFA